MKNYNHKKIEAKWQKYWEREKAGQTTDDLGKEKKYILDMFPYPSGAGLHVGHVESYTATDIYSRYLRMRGYNVMHPQGWDAFGLPAENYAIKTGVHPVQTTKQAIATFKRQIKSMGFLYDWDREVNSSDSAYYKWTQWLFLFLYKNGLAYKKKAKVNWCESCQTVLANEQADGGKCDRCGSAVKQKDLEQWFFRITDFIKDQEYEGRKITGLLSALDNLDWPESTKRGQRNWIGRSVGAEVDFSVNGEKVTVFTTRPDTLFGATYFVLSPEHELIKKLESKIKNYKEVEDYVKKAKLKTELERTDLAKEKTGVRLEGIKAINPVNNEEIPVFIADYVLTGYGTGAIMAVPAHDERDWEFAKKYNLPIIEVLQGGNVKQEAYIGDGTHVNSQFLDGLNKDEAIKKIIKWLEEKKLGKKAVNYRLRDWLVSRQRYWGAPIPIIYCGQCGEVPVPEADLPVELPDDVGFKPTGESPLKYSKSFQAVKCPKCGQSAKRESDTMDTFVCSSWYYLRYADPKNTEEFASQELLKKWLPVDVYVGGAEHTVLHLLYSRFFTKVLQKYGLVDFNEPFTKLRHQGIILAEDGNKMSKSKGNVINPDDVVKEYGADALRLYEMFMGPLEDMKPWNTKRIVGIGRFLEKIWKLKLKVRSKKLEIKKDIEILLNKTIKKVTEDIESFKFNTAISQMMIFINHLEKEKEIDKNMWEKFLIILSPFAPHLAEELWFHSQKGSTAPKEDYGAVDSIFKQEWPEYNKKLVVDDKIKLVLQVNGKVRDMIETAADIPENEAKKIAMESDKIKKWTAGKEIAKIIFVKGKLVNVVVE
ncbi:MAG: leucine--tRNA ligase [Patescibacteria group bacterium]|nr:leucine--tRNA ligase [Patescibacteria group bacterium]